MQNYLHNLIARIPSKPLRIRIGGNGMDGSTYVRKLKPALRIQDPSAYFNDIPVEFGAGFFELLNGMADKVGAMQFAIGLSMRNIKGDFNDSLKNVVDLAKDAKKMLGGRLDSLFLGNEPDLYKINGKRSSYDVNTYIPEVDQTVAALTKADVLTSAIPSLTPGKQFAMALWSIDVGLKAASLGFSAAYIHTREFGIQYNLFDPPAADTSRSMESGWRTGTPYYATLFLAEVTSPEGNIVVDLNLHDPRQTPNANASATVAGYAIYSAKDRGRQKLVFINYSDSDSQPFRIGANTTYKVEYRTLTAQSVRETKNVTWGGQTIGGYGNLVGPGAVLVTLGNSATLFKGNTTIAAPGESGARTNRQHWPLGLIFMAGTIMLLSS
ncbi:hypothetical protein H1R20_g7296, partial [Candolleomyces eurysporus]